MNIGIAATDGWATTSSSTFNCKIGLALTGGAISLTKGGSRKVILSRPINRN